ncbi:hypothetical protein DXG01_001476 [Tephrocybe rancida]|nr:hypothetical protein DXG01_001476 [Tephrocybe rancida]
MRAEGNKTQPQDPSEIACPPKAPQDADCLTIQQQTGDKGVYLQLGCPPEEGCEYQSTRCFTCPKVPSTQAAVVDTRDMGLRCGYFNYTGEDNEAEPLGNCDFSIWNGTLIADEENEPGNDGSAEPNGAPAAFAAHITETKNATNVTCPVQATTDLLCIRATAIALTNPRAVCFNAIKSYNTSSRVSFSVVCNQPREKVVQTICTLGKNDLVKQQLFLEMGLKVVLALNFTSIDPDTFCFNYNVR